MMEVATVALPAVPLPMIHSIGTQLRVLWGVVSSSDSSIEAPRAVRGAAALKIR
jgi:hypothetical protein